MAGTCTVCTAVAVQCGVGTGCMCAYVCVRACVYVCVCACVCVCPQSLHASPLPGLLNSSGLVIPTSLNARNLNTPLVSLLSALTVLPACDLRAALLAEASGCAGSDCAACCRALRPGPMGAMKECSALQPALCMAQTQARCYLPTRLVCDWDTKRCGAACEISHSHRCRICTHIVCLA